MARTLEQILAELAALKAEDFDNRPQSLDGNERLNELTDELLALPEPEQGIRALFDVIERMPDADLGSPGPLVQTLEQMRGQYEAELAESIKRKPTQLSVWMVNRILNGTRNSELRQSYLRLLRFAAEHPTAPESARQAAQRFIEHQGGQPC